MANLPTITSLANLGPMLKAWQQALNPVVNRPQPPRCPFNVRLSSPTGSTGVLIQWEQVPQADGYRVYYSDSGDFSGDSVLATLPSPLSTAYFDSVGVTGKNRFYRVASTAGTPSQPQSVEGVKSAPLQLASGSGQVVYDTTSDNTGSSGFNRPIRPSQGPGGYNPL